MPFDAHPAELIRAALAQRRGITEKRMFGGIFWMLHRNMLCGVETGRYLVRFGPALEAKARPDVAPMDFTGGPMRGFVRVEADAGTDDGLGSWIALAVRFVGALPPKGVAPARTKRPRRGEPA